MEVIFPQYRRYLNGNSYFRIDSAVSFEEIRRLGSRWLVESYTARILPDRNLVNDLLFDFQSFAVEITADEYLSARSRATEK